MVRERAHQRGDRSRDVRLRRGDRGDDAAHGAPGRDDRRRPREHGMGSAALRRPRRDPAADRGRAAVDPHAARPERHVHVLAMADTEGMSHVFHRVLSRPLPRAVRAEGVWIEDAEGRRYLDGAGGAIVVNVGHGDRSLVDAMAEQSARTSYVHGTAFTTEALESYADAVAPVLPLDDPRIYPVSGGSEAVETAIKLARAFHLARGEDSRTLVIGRQASYHGNTLGALDAGGKEALRRPYEPWLGRFEHVDAAYEFRCPNPDHPADCGPWHAERLDRAVVEAGPSTVAAFIAEPVAGATLAAAVPTDDYWSAIVEVCRRHGVLLIADEVMTGFGRTGRWFGVDHWGVRPDVLVAAKGATSGYWPFGFVAASDAVHDAVAGGPGFIHGF